MAREPEPPDPNSRWHPSGGEFGRGSDERLGAIVGDARDIDRQIACLQARRASVLDAAFDLAEFRAEQASARSQEHELIIRDVSAELGAALRVSDRYVQGELADAAMLVHRFPFTHAALEAGRITLAHARVILRAGGPIEDDVRRADFDELAVGIAEQHSPGRLRARIAMPAERARTSSIDDRHRAARDERCVFTRDIEDGMCEVTAIVPSVLAHAIKDRLNRFARHITRRRTDAEEAPDQRTIGQIEADVFADLLLTTDPAAAGDAVASIRAHVQVNIPTPVLTGAVESGAELVGHGPIDSDTARSLAALAPGWDRLFIDPVSQNVLSVDRYRPSAAQRRILRVRDEHCRFPGCGYPAIRSDADHTVDAALGGPTAIQNLGHFCRRHHTLKHHTRWRADNLPGGIIRWTSPLGTTYTDHPPRTVVFTPDTADDEIPF
ncbi:HNH endonuclease signature motif containing protein [Microbacterium gorillae]|uniref:HNH endonuclease signature motif containing protein n=1 Tax=Microbacterium gorillae TaxID=1231063 RepID=UPI0018A80B46|nr:HNH endonuclease signature motif containing protein [Microbacterium gorillae]